MADDEFVGFSGEGEVEEPKPELPNSAAAAHVGDREVRTERGRWAAGNRGRPLGTPNLVNARLKARLAKIFDEDEEYWAGVFKRMKAGTADPLDDPPLGASIWQAEGNRRSQRR